MEDDPEYDIAIARVSGSAPPSDAVLQSAIEATLRHHHTSAARISVALVDDTRIADLNAAHLGHHGPTDVLAFDLSDASECPPARARDRAETAPRPRRCASAADKEMVDGEIIVSVDTAQREAVERGHSIEAELALYVVHGTLHLLGYNDDCERDAVRMHEMEDEILSSVGIGPAYRGLSR